MDSHHSKRIKWSYDNDPLPNNTLILPLVDGCDLNKILCSSEMWARMPTELRRYMDAFARMEKAGRFEAARGQSTQEEGVDVLASVLNHLDSLFVHLQENPALCIRD